MSNPGVIALIHAKINFKKALSSERLQIEDNIGESIHIHYRNMRFDYTITDFLKLVEGFEKSLEVLLNKEGVDIKLLSPTCLHEYRFQLQNLKATTIEIRSLNELKCVIYDSGHKSPYVVKDIQDSPVYKYLETQDVTYLKGVFGDTPLVETKDRIARLQASLEKGYGEGCQYITLFGDQNIIRDGSIRAAILCHMKKCSDVSVVVCRFKNEFKGFPLKNSTGFWDRRKWDCKQINNHFKKIAKKSKAKRKAKKY